MNDSEILAYQAADIAGIRCLLVHAKEVLKQAVSGEPVRYPAITSGHHN